MKVHYVQSEPVISTYFSCTLQIRNAHKTIVSRQKNIFKRMHNHIPRFLSLE
jgi:hypothetical protein